MKHGPRNVSIGIIAITPELLFLVCFVFVGFLNALFLPAGGGLDEEQHIERVEQICRGGGIP